MSNLATNQSLGVRADRTSSQEAAQRLRARLENLSTIDQSELSIEAHDFNPSQGGIDLSSKAKGRVHWSVWADGFLNGSSSDKPDFKITITQVEYQFGQGLKFDTHVMIRKGGEMREVSGAQYSGTSLDRAIDAIVGAFGN